MPAVRNVLVVGAGAAGTATAILLAERRRLRRPRSTSSPTSARSAPASPCRATRCGCCASWASGTQVREHGLRLRHPRSARARPGRHADRRARRRHAPAAPTCRPRWACTGPTLARILRRPGHRPSGAKVRFGATCTDARPGRRRRRRRPSPTAPPAATTSSSAPTASGRGPAARSASTLETRSTGMGIWRVFAPRPASRSPAPTCIYGGPCYIAGYCPTGEDTLYAYLVEDAQDRSGLTPSESLEVMRELVARPTTGRGTTSATG